MLKRMLILLPLVLAQTGCLFYDEERYYQPATFTTEGVQSYERLKRDLLQLEDIKVGDGPIAAAGRKVTADIVARYSDGTLIYQGPAVTYWGIIGDTFIHNSPREPSMLSTEQEGVMLGLNGMAVGGKRRIIVPPNLVCYNGRTVGQSLDKGANPNANCGLVYGERELVKVRKEQLTIDATLTASCRPVFLRTPIIYLGQRCRDSETPKNEPSDPIWRFYHAAPSEP